MISDDDYSEVYEQIQALPEDKRDLLEAFQNKLAYDFVEYYCNPDRSYGEIVNPDGELDSWLEEHDIEYTEGQSEAWIAGMRYGARIEYEDVLSRIEGDGLEYFL